MKKVQKRLLLVLLSALMVIFVCGISAYADDTVTGLRTSTHKIVIKNQTGRKIMVKGLEGPAAYNKEQANLITATYTKPDVLTNIYSNDIIMFETTIPGYEVSASTEPGYKYCLKFTDEEEYDHTVSLTLKKDTQALLMSFNSNNGEDETVCMTVRKNKEFSLPDSDTFEKEGHELIGWTSDGEKVYEPGEKVSFGSDRTFNAVWEHVHKWSLVKTGATTAELECHNKGCEWYQDPVTISLEAKDASYSDTGYDIGENLIANTDRKEPEGEVFLKELAFRHLGKKIDLPVDTGNYTAAVTLALDDDADEEVTLTDSFRIKKAINYRIPFLNPDFIEDWTECDKPSKPDLSWTKARNPLVVYTDTDSLGKITAVIGKLMNEDDNITIDDLKDLKGVQVSLVPPAKAGDNYAVIVVGVSKNYYDLGINMFAVNEKEGAVHATVRSWTYGEYDQSVNGPKVTVGGNDVSGAADFLYRQLLPCDDEDDTYYVFDPEHADAVNAGLYLMKIIVNDNSGETKEIYRIFKVSKAPATVLTPLAAKDLVADGEEHALVTEGECTGGRFFYSVRRVDESDDDMVLGSYEVPTASEAGTYIVRYRFIPYYNYYSGVVKGRVKVVIRPEPEPADDDDSVTPDDPVTQTDADTDDATDEEYEQIDSKMPGIAAKKPAAGKTSVTVRWKKLNRKNVRKCDGIEIMIASDRNFTDSVTVTAGRKASSCRIGSLGRKTTYYVRVRTYRINDDVKFVGKWSRVKKVRTR